MIALSTLVVGCTKSDVLESSKTFESPISFEPYTGKAPVTKATEATIGTIQAENVGFKVTGFLQGTTIDATDFTKPYMDKTVTCSDSNKNTWTYEGAAYWPQSGSLCFVAYGLNASDNFVPTTAGSYTNFTYTVQDDVADQTDLVVSNIITDKSLSADPVSVTLNHVLSKVGFSVKTNNAAEANNVSVTIKNVTLNGKFVNKGTVNLTASTAAITPSTNTADITECYSLFDSSYKKGDATTTALPCFNTGNSTSATPIYASRTFTNDTEDPTQLTLGTATSPNENDRFMMIMPGTVGNLDDDVTPYIEVVYQLTDAEEQVAKVPLVQSTKNDAGATITTNWNFLPGTSYEFVFTVSTTAIGFTVTVGTWTDYPTTDTTYTLTPEA